MTVEKIELVSVNVATPQYLGQHRGHGGPHQERLDPDLDEARDGAWRAS